MGMEQREVTIRFLAPAFLGDAEQKAAWRVPPFKAQLRQWWRVVMAARGCSLPEMRVAEGRLFGDAAGEDGNRSRVRLRLDRWRRGGLTDWENARGTGNLTIGSGKATIPADLYLAYGAVERPPRSNPKLANEPAIGVDETANLRIAWPKGADNGDAIDSALELMNRLGTVGGRSRNGWGSYRLDGLNGVDLKGYAVDWGQAVADSQWARGVGRDEQGLLMWRTGPQRDWPAVIKELGRIRKDVNTQIDDRCLLSYPVTKKSQPGWSNQDRVPNSLRFKVVDAEGDGKAGLLFHMPCRPSDDLWKRLNDNARRAYPKVWRAVHEILDETPSLERVAQ